MTISACPHCEESEQPIDELIGLPSTFRPHPGVEVRIVPKATLRRIHARYRDGDSSWVGVAGVFLVRVNGTGTLVEQKFILLTPKMRRMDIAHEVGHIAMGHALLRQHCWRDRLTHELEAWNWTFTKSRRHGEQKWMKWEHLSDILYWHMLDSEETPRITIREAKVVLNRRGVEVPRKVWEKMRKWLEEIWEEEHSDAPSPT